MAGYRGDGRGGKLSFLLSSFALAGCGSAERGETASVIEQRLELEVGPPIGTDAPVPLQYSTGSAPGLASDGAGYLSLFSDNSDVRGIRVDASGKVLDLPWLNFAEEPLAQTYPAAAFNGSDYLVAWWQFASEPDYSAIHARLVHPDGTLEGSASVRVSDIDALYPSVTYNGRDFLLSYGDNDIYVARVDGDGNKVADSEKPVTNNDTSFRSRVAAGSTYSLVTWYEQDTNTGEIFVRAARVDHDGEVIDPGGIRLSTTTNYDVDPVVAAAGDRFLVAFRSSPLVGGTYRVLGVLVDGSGLDLEIEVPDIAVSRSPEAAGAPSVAFNGEEFLVAWVDERDDESDFGVTLYGARVSTAGVVLDAQDRKLTDGSPRSLFSDFPQLAYGDGQYLLTFWGNGIQGNVIDEGYDYGPTLGLSPLANRQSSPRVAWNGEHYLVAWTDEREGPNVYSARAVRIDTSGSVLDTESISFSDEDSRAQNVNLASGDGFSVATWYDPDAGTNWYRRVNADGSLGPLANLTPLSVSATGIVGNGSSLLASFVAREEDDSYTLNGRFFGPSGDAAPSSFPLRVLPAYSSTAVYPAAQGYLVLFAEDGTHLLPVSATGVVGEPLQVATGNPYPLAATNGEDTLVVWSTGSLIEGRFVADGAWAGEAFEITNAASYIADVEWNGSTFLVIWEDDELHIHFRDVNTDRTMGDAGPVVVDADCSIASLAYNGGEQLLLTCYEYQEGFRTSRVVSRIIGEPIVPDGAGGAGAGGAGDGAASGGGPSGGAGDGPDGATSTGAGGAGPGVGTDAGAPAGSDAGENDAGVESPHPPSSGCGPCSVGRGSRPSELPGALLALVLAAAAVARRRPRRC